MKKLYAYEIENVSGRIVGAYIVLARSGADGSQMVLGDLVDNRVNVRQLMGSSITVAEANSFKHLGF